MLKYLSRRLLLTIPTLLAISAVIFGLLAIAPSNPFGDMANNPAITPEVRENLRRALGLDDPIPVRYIKWLVSMVQGNMGFSFNSRSPVSELILQRLPATLWVLGAGYLVSLLLAIPLGILSAVKRNSWIDRMITTISFIGFSLPTFFTGLVFILVFSVQLGWVPFIYSSTLIVQDVASFIQLVKQSVLPVIVLALFQTAILMRFVRAAVIEELPQGYVQTAYAKGLSKLRILNVHILRNASIPVVTLVALDIPSLFTGSLVLEQVFRIPGIGALLIDSIKRSDTPVIMGISFIYAVLVVLFNLLADVLYSWIDPRVRV